MHPEMVLTEAGFGDWLTTLLVSMLPVIELRGAIPIGCALGLPVWKAAAVSIIGNMIPVPFITTFIRYVFDWLRRLSPGLDAWVERITQKAWSKSGNIQKYEFWGLVLFVAVPLPGTGAWTGALIASLLNFSMKKTIGGILCGVLIAAVLISLATAGVISFIL